MSRLARRATQRRGLAGTVLVGVGLAWALAAGAQGGAREASLPPLLAGAHGGLAAPRPLHVRMALASRAAIAIVDRIDTGRIALREVVALRGELAPEIEIKRSPSRPPNVVGEEVLLLHLDGARSPYLLLDSSRELLRLPESSRDHWVPPLRALAEGRLTPAGLAALYETWLGVRSEALRTEGLRGLRDPEAPFQPLDESFTRRRLAVAFDAERSVPLRNASAAAALIAPGGLEGLLAGIPWRVADAPELIRLAFAAPGAMAPSTRPAIVRCLEHPSPEIRRIAVDASARRRHDAVLRAALVRASEDPDEEVARRARRAIAAGG